MNLSFGSHLNTPLVPLNHNIVEQTRSHLINMHKNTDHLFGIWSARNGHLVSGFCLQCDSVRIPLCDSPDVPYVSPMDAYYFCTECQKEMRSTIENFKWLIAPRTPSQINWELEQIAQEIENKLQVIKVTCKEAIEKSNLPPFWVFDVFAEQQRLNYELPDL